MMFKITLISVFLFFCFAQAGCYSQPADKIDDAYTYDFGRVKEGEIVKHDFKLKNESQNTWNIKGINTSCGCTGSKAEKNSLLPGEETLVEVKFNTKGYSGKTQQYVYVNTDSIDNPLIRFIIKAEVVK